MKVAGGGFEQCCNAQGVVDTESMLILAPHVTQVANDKEQVEPMVAKIQALPEGLNQPEALLADTGYFSERNVQACQGAKIVPLIAVGRARRTIRTGAAVSRSRCRCAPRRAKSNRRGTRSRRRPVVPPTRYASRRWSPCSASSSR